MDLVVYIKLRNLFGVSSKRDVGKLAWSYGARKGKAGLMQIRAYVQSTESIHDINSKPENEMTVQFVSYESKEAGRPADIVFLYYMRELPFLISN